MLRLYRSTAEQLLLLTLFNKREVGLSLAQMSERLRSITLNDYNQHQTLKQARSTRIPDKALDDLVETLFKGLIADSQGGGETDLIDRMVTALQTPFTRNVLSGETMARLRSALLLPSESGGLTARLTTKEMSCGGCGKPLHDLESVTLSRDARNGQVVLCHRCVAPQTVPCATCEATAALSTKAMNAMSRMQCPTCLEAKVVVPKKGEKGYAQEYARDPEPSPVAPRFLTSNYRMTGTPVAAAPPRERPRFVDFNGDEVTETVNGVSALQRDMERLQHMARQQAAASAILADSSLRGPEDEAR